MSAPERALVTGPSTVRALLSVRYTGDLRRDLGLVAGSCRLMVEEGSRKILFEDFWSWLSGISKIYWEPTTDVSCAKYEFTDALLCHDDELEGRWITFILYLVLSWDRSLGGTPDLYDTDEHFQPKQIVKSLTPLRNELVFFEVSAVSFHQVSEVLSEVTFVYKWLVSWSFTD
ncbi:hypothetical protein H8958_011631 [Nasalis larvatus]